MLKKFPSLGMALALLLFAFTLHASLLPSLAWAGHYYVEDVELFSPEVTRQLQDLGIKTTEDFLKKCLTPEDRAFLAQKTALTPDEVHLVARLVELIQINGIGPKAARLLMTAGVQSIDDLAHRNPQKLLDKLVQTNTKHQITGVQPDIIVVKDWIQKAQKATYHVQWEKH